MEWYWWLLTSILGIYILFGFFAFGVVFQMTRGKRTTLKGHFDYCKKWGYPSEFPDMISEKMNFTLSDGYLLHGEWIGVPNAKGIIICCHGHLALRESSRKYADFFNELGYSVIIYDHRGHGENVLTPVTMGYKESKDLAEVISQVRKKFGKDVLLGIHGESMGGATVLMCLKYCPDVDFVIEDCGYASLKKELKDLSEKRLHIPFFLIASQIDILLRLTSGFGMKNVRPIKDISNSQVPILFIHGTIDTYVRPNNAQLLYDSYKGKKKLVFVKGARHALSIYTDRNLYIEAVTEFLNECKKNEK